MTCFVTKALPINSIDSKCHTEKLKGSRTCLIGYSDFISHELFLIAQGADTHIHTHTNVRMKAILRNQARAWFNNLTTYVTGLQKGSYTCIQFCNFGKS